MCPDRVRQTIEGLNEQARTNLARTTVFAVGVSQYRHLDTLSGPRRDLELVKEIFSSTPDLSLYHDNQYITLSDPTVEQLRSRLIEYATSRSARGDILIFYFSGHGAIVGTNEFGLCVADTRVGMEGSGVLPLSTVSFSHIVGTLTAVDVHPIFILDACFSAATVRSGNINVGASIQEELGIHAAASYGLLCSSNMLTPSVDTYEGGAFTQALHAIVTQGLGNEEGRHRSFLTISDLAAPLQETLSQQGSPLSRCYVGADLPEVPIAINAKFSPINEYFAPYMKRLVQHLWNNGNPVEVAINDLKEFGAGAYGNHSKLSLEPWQLLEDGDQPYTRRLTDRGKQFVQGELEIPRRIIKDPVSLEWVPMKGTESIGINEI